MGIKCKHCRTEISEKSPNKKYCNRKCYGLSKRGKKEVRTRRTYRKGRLVGKRSNRWGKKSYVWSASQNKEVLMRSSWEVNVALWLDLQGISWEYEPKRFDLGTTTYQPDFYLPEREEWIEVKGRWIGKSKSKFNKFRSMYPDESMNLFDSDVYKLVVSV